MKAEIIKIGNSKGIRIPKPILESCGFEGAVELEVEKGRLVISARHQVRENWSEAFRQMNEAGDDLALIPEDSSSEWDETEWQW